MSIGRFVTLLLFATYSEFFYWSMNQSKVIINKEERGR